VTCADLQALSRRAVRYNALCTDQPTPHVPKAAFTVVAGSPWEQVSSTVAGLYPQMVKREQSLGFVKSPCKAQHGLRHGGTKAIYGFVGGSGCVWDC